MNVLGDMFPGPKVLDEASEAGDGQKWRLGPIDLEKGVVEVHLFAAEQPVEPSAPEASPS